MVFTTIPGNPLLFSVMLAMICLSSDTFYSCFVSIVSSGKVYQLCFSFQKNTKYSFKYIFCGFGGVA